MYLDGRAHRLLRELAEGARPGEPGPWREFTTIKTGTRTLLRDLLSARFTERKIYQGKVHYRITVTGLEQIGLKAAIQSWTMVGGTALSRAVADGLGIRLADAEQLVAETIDQGKPQIIRTRTEVTGRLGNILGGTAEWRLTAQEDPKLYRLELLERK